jgi:hypothetical protein
VIGSWWLHIMAAVGTPTVVMHQKSGQHCAQVPGPCQHWQFSAPQALRAASSCSAAVLVDRTAEHVTLPDLGGEIDRPGRGAVGGVLLTGLVRTVIVVVLHHLDQNTT